MLKPGIVSSVTLRRFPSWFGSMRHVSFLLLAELAKDPTRNVDLYDRVVAQARMPNGVWKRTGKGRLAEVDALALEVLSRRVPAGSQLTVFDVAASTGVTSVEFFERLAPGFAVEFVASDLYRDLFAVQSPRWPWTGIFDTFRQEVQHVVGPFVLPAQTQESLAYPVNRVLKRLCRAWFVTAAQSILARADIATLEPFAIRRIDDYEVTKLTLLSSDCLRMVREDPRFRFEVWDILQPLPGCAHIIRAMNILSRDQFPDDLRARAIHNLIDASLPHGLLILGWSPSLDSNVVQATVYEVANRALRRLASINGGSEIDRFVESLVPVHEVE
jgi:hypothetical protein